MINELLRLVQHNPEKAKKLATALNSDDIRIKAIANMDANPDENWTSIALFLRDNKVPGWNKVIAEMMRVQTDELAMEMKITDNLNVMRGVK